MAYVSTRRLTMGEINTDQIVAMATGLDTSYNGTIRNIVWSCYEGTSTLGELIHSFKETIPNGKSVVSHVFSNLKKGTNYYITAVISNIEGVTGEVLYWGTQSTADEGGSDYDDPTAGPRIKRFTAYQTKAGEKKIGFDIQVANLYYSTAFDREYSIKIGYLDENDNFKVKGDTSNSGSSVRWQDSFDVPKYGIYTVKLDIIQQMGDVDYTAIRYTTVEVSDGKPICVLDISWDTRILGKDNFSALAGSESTLNCNAYPTITADNWNAFCTDINTVRVKASLPEYEAFITAVAGAQITAEIYNHVYYAINALYDKYEGTTGAAKPNAFKEVNPGNEINGNLLNALQAAIQTMRDYFYT